MQIIHGNGEKKGGPSSSIITPYFGFTNLTKKTNETQQMFIEDLVFYIYKGLWTLSTTKNILLRRSVLC
jgi:hypothetical protein